MLKMLADISIDQIKRLRDETGIGVMEAKSALEKAGGDFGKAKEFLKKEGLVKAEKKVGREVLHGKICSYIHSGGKVGVLLEVNCETDFAADTPDFKTLCLEIAMQIAAMEPKTVKDLLEQEYIRDPSRTIDELVKGTIAKIGENIVIKRFVRYELGIPKS